MYRVTIQLVANLLLTSKHKYRFGLAWPKLNFYFEANWRFATS